MINLVPVPYDPRYKGTPAAVALLMAACKLAGHNIPLVDGWRPYAQQKYLYDGWVARKPGFNLASNPDDPNAQNNHLRGEAWDIANPSADGQFMSAVGFIRDASESWHYNEPHWRNYPIVKTDDSNETIIATEVAQSLVLLREEDDNMPTPVYAKGDKDPAVYACYQNAGDGNSATGTQGGVYFARRRVESGEWLVVEGFKVQTGHFPDSAQTSVIVVPQDTFDAIPKVKGSA